MSPVSFAGASSYESAVEQLNAGLAGLLHEAIAGEAPSSAEIRKLKQAYDVEAAKAKTLEVELKTTKAEVARQAGQIKAQAFEIALHQSYLADLHAQLMLAEQEALAKEATARRETRESFLYSPSGGRFLDLFRTELLKLYHDSMPFLGRLYPAAKQYLLIGATRALEQARATGNLDEFSEPDLIRDMPDPEGWSGDSSQSLDYP